MNPIFKMLYAASDVVDRIKGMSWTSASSWGGLNVFMNRTRIDYAREVGDVARNSIVVAVVGWIARNFPEAPVRIRKLNPDGSSEAIRPSETGAGYMLQLLERPNPYVSGVLQWMATVVDLFTGGNAFWIKVRNGSQSPTDRVQELWWVPRRYMRPRWPTDGSRYISHYEYLVDGIPYRVETHNVIHFREGIDPENPRMGLSRLASLLREVYTDDQAANMTASLMTNLGVPGVILAPSNTTPANQKSDPEKIKSSFMEKFGGDKIGEPMVLTSPTDVKVLSWSPSQMDLRALRRIPEERISAVLGVSAIVAGLGAGLDRSTFSNFGEARKAAYQESIVPLQRLIAAEIENQLLDDFADRSAGLLDVDFDTSKASALQEAWDAVWRRAESAAARGLITVQDFQRTVGIPVDPGVEVYLRPMNITTVERGLTFEPKAYQLRDVTGDLLLPGTNGHHPQLNTGVPT